MDIKIIKDLMLRFDKSDITKLKLKQEDITLELEKSVETNYTNDRPTHVETFPFRSESVEGREITDDYTKNSSESADKRNENKLIGDTINSPMVGTFYQSPSPDTDAFIKVGDTVKAGDALCVIEAMKIMNKIEAEFDCKINKILVKDGHAIEYDMPLFEVEKI